MADVPVPFIVEPPQPDGIRLISRVGVGRRSQWFEAEQVRLGRTIAVKYLRPSLAESAQFRTAFFDAGRQSASIIHPSALSVINIFTREQCIAMQWCPGTPLREIKSVLDPVSVASFGLSVLDCLSSLHATGRSHGNISPGNVFMNRQGMVWIGDFFQPPAMSDGARTFVGDQRFIAPESLISGRTDWRSDVYALGRLMAHIFNPAKESEPLFSLMVQMQHNDTELRAASPLDLIQELTRIRDVEIAKSPEYPSTKRGKRLYRRVPAEFDVSLRRRSASPIETAALLRKIRDIGESGVFVETDDALVGVGTILEMDFNLRGSDGHVHAYGIVRWRSAPPMPPGVGVQFVEIEQSGLSQLRDYLHTIR